MPRYFFHIIHPGNDVVPDDEGAEFEDIETAKSEAIASLRDIAGDAMKHGRKVNGLAIQIADESGAIRDTITVEEMFE